MTIILLPGRLPSETGSLLEHPDFNILILVLDSLSLLPFSKEQLTRAFFGEQSKIKEFPVEVIRKELSTRCLRLNMCAGRRQGRGRNLTVVLPRREASEGENRSMGG